MFKNYPPPFLVVALRVPGLLSIPRFLLLALLVLAPALALAQTRQQVWNSGYPSGWSARINDAPFGTVNLFEVHRNTSEFGTGLKFSHQTQCPNGGGAVYFLSYAGSGNSNILNHVKLLRNDNVSSTSGLIVTLANTANQYVTLNVKANQVFTDEVTLGMRVSLVASCELYGAHRLAHMTIKLLAQRDIRTAESLVAASVFRTDRLLASSTAVTTGIVLQRGTMRCPTSMGLLDHTDYLRLQHLNPTGNALTGSLLTAHTGVAMGGTNARALALLFKGTATVSAATLTAKVKVESVTTNQNCPAAFAKTVTVKLTAGASLAWTTGSDDVTVASGVLGSPFNDKPTGIRIDRYAGSCETMKVSLPDQRVTGAGNVQARVRDIMQLRSVDEGFDTPVLGSPGFDITVDDINLDDSYARLELKGSPPAGTLRVTAVVTPGCSTEAALADPQMLSYLVTVEGNAWEAESKDSASTTLSFAAPALAASSTPTPTGIRLHRSSTNCRVFDVTMRSGAGNWLGLLRMTVNGNSTTAVGAQGRGFTGVHMQDGNAADNHFRLVFSANANVGATTRVERATVEVRPSSTCAASDRPANPLMLTYMVSIRAGYREVGSNETLRAAAALLINELAASATAVTTGIKFQRGVESCPNTSMRLLNHTSYLRLQPVNAGGALSGSPAVSHANVPMFSGIAANNRALALLFAPRSNVAAGTVTVRVRVASGTSGAGCTGLQASTITASVTLVDPTTWQAGSKARSQAASVLLTTEIGTGADTGIRFSHFTAACSDSRLVLSDTTVTVSTVPARARAIARFSRYTSADVREAAHVGFDITVANAANNAYARLEMIGAPPAGTLTLEAVASPACSPVPPGVDPLTLSYVVTLADPLEWQTGPKSRSSAASVLVSAEIATQPDTGIRFHSYTAACDSARLVLTDSAVAGAGSAQARTIARFQSYTAGDAKDGAPGHTLELASLSSGIHAGLELMGAPPVGTLTFEAVATATCPSPPNIKPLTLSYQVTIREASATVQTTVQAVQATVSQATGAAVTRVVGLSAIAAVMGRAADDGEEGQSLLGLLAAKEELLESGDIDLRSFLAGQEFALGLDASATGRPGFGVWGRAEFLQLEQGGAADPFRHEGDMFSAQLGADYRTAGGALIGLSYGQHQLDTDYAGSLTGADAYAGNYVLQLDVAQPYAAWPLEVGHLAGAVAVGSGEAELKDAGADAGETYDADYLGWALGYRAPVSGGGLEVEGALSGGSLDIPDLGPAGSKSDNMSLRTGVRYAPAIDLGGGSLRPSAGVAVAIDWGDDPGHKYELSAGLGYAGQRLAAAAEYIYIGMDEGDVSASGGSVDLRFSAAAGNLGLGLAATPAHGPAAGADLLANPETGMRGSAEIGYGLAVNGGVLTPYGGWSFATEAGEVGLRLRQGDGGSWLLRWREADRDMIAIEFSLLGD